MVYIVEAEYQDSQTAVGEANKLVSQVPELSDFIQIVGGTIVVRNSTEEKANETKDWLNQYTEPEEVSIESTEEGEEETSTRKKVVEGINKARQTVGQIGQGVGTFTRELQQGSGQQGAMSPPPTQRRTARGPTEAVWNAVGAFYDYEKAQQAERNLWRKHDDVSREVTDIVSVKDRPDGQSHYLTIRNTTKDKAEEALEWIREENPEDSFLNQGNNVANI